MYVCVCNSLMYTLGSVRSWTHLIQKMSCHLSAGHCSAVDSSLEEAFQMLVFQYQMCTCPRNANLFVPAQCHLLQMTALLSHLMDSLTPPLLSNLLSQILQRDHKGSGIDQSGWLIILAGWGTSYCTSAAWFMAALQKLAAVSRQAAPDFR